MYLIYFFIILYNIVYAEETNHAKYIDVLPDDQKAMVLEKIAKRIMADVRVQDQRDQYTGELPDDLLEKHDAFVKQILKEESENLRRGNKETEKKSNKENKHIDLTLRTHETGKEKLDEIPVVVNYNASDTKEVVNQNNVKESGSVEDIQIKSLRRNLEETTTTTMTAKSSTKEMEGTQILNFEAPAKIHGSEEDPKSVETTKASTTVTSSDILSIPSEFAEETATEAVYASEVDKNVLKHEKEEMQSVTEVNWSREGNNNSDVSNEKHNKKFTNASNENETKEPIGNGIFDPKTDIISSTVTILSQDVIQKTKNSDITFTVNDISSNKPDSVEIRTSTTEMNESIQPLRDKSIPETTTEVTDATSTKVTETITVDPNEDTKTNASEIKTNKTSPTTNSVTEANFDTTDNPVTQPNENPKLNINNEKQDILRTESEKLIKANELMAAETLDEKEEHLGAESGGKHDLMVFEVDANKPFMRTQRLDEEEPYYVPIYNYAPNNAYFNAHNRLGPNEEESTTDYKKELRGSNRFDDEYYFEDDKNMVRVGIRQEPKKHFLKQYNVNAPLKDASHASKRNPEENENLDYYIGKVMRGGQDFPSSGEQEHPFNSMRLGNLKSHLSAVRSILFGKSLYGSERVREPEILRAGKAKFEKRDNFVNGESIDHYSGRVRRESDADDLKKIGYIKQKNLTRNVFVEEIPKEDVKLINFDNKHFVKSDYQVTPHTEYMDDLKNDTLKPSQRFFWFFKKDKTKPRTTTTQFVSQDGKLDTITKIINMTDEADVFVNLETLHDLKVPIRLGRDDDAYLSAYVNVLKDMVHMNDDGLKQYDWLGSTVNLQAALNKLANLTAKAINHERIHPLDLELLQYAVYLHKASQSEVEHLRKEEISRSHLSQKKRVRSRGRKSDAENDLHKFYGFIDHLLYHLYDLHMAIKNIAAVTKYRQQNWFKNLKEVYFADDRDFLNVILHLSTNRLFKLVEKSTKEGLENDFIGYILRHESSALETLEEFKFVVKLMNIK